MALPYEFQKTITIAGNWLHTNATPDVFTEQIDVAFIPDEIIVRYASYYDVDTNPSNSMSYVRSSLIDNHVLLSIPAVTSFQGIIEQRYRNYKQIQNLYTFSISNYDNSRITNYSTVNSFLSITFEFVKYRENKN